MRAESAFSVSNVSGIGVMREGPLHAGVKALLARPDDRVEVPVGRFVIDVVRADGELVEVQTGSFSALAPKLDALPDSHRIRVVHPVAAQRRIVRINERGEVVASRRSPTRGTALQLFERLVSFASLLSHPNLVIEVLLLREDHVRSGSPVTRRRRTRDPGERRLVDVLDRIELREPEDLLGVLPALPGGAFTTRELAALLGCSLGLAQRAGVLPPGDRPARAGGVSGKGSSAPPTRGCGWVISYVGRRFPRLGSRVPDLFSPFRRGPP